MKKILLVATIPLSLKVFSFAFMKFMQTHGYDVQAAASDGPEAHMLRKSGIPFHAIDFSRTISPWHDWRAYRSLRTLLAREQFDVVHTQTSKAGFIGRLAARRARVPLIVHTAHNWAFHALLPRPIQFAYRFLERAAARWCDAIIVDTQAVRRCGIQQAVAKPDAIHQIYMGINTERFHPFPPGQKRNMREAFSIPQDKIVVGCISRLVRDKGLETLVACARQLKAHPQFFFVLVGDGPLRDFLIKEVNTCGLQHQFIFLGHHDDVVPIINTFDLFCLPTLREGFGVVFAEAQACGVPVVASDIGPLRESTRNGVTSMLVAPHDVADFVAAIKKLQDASVREAYGRAAREFVVKNFGVQRINEQTLALYTKLWKEKVSA